MSSVPSSADSWPARRSCLYMLRISCFCCSNRWRRASYPSAGLATAGLTFCDLATLATPFKKLRRKFQPKSEPAMIAHSRLDRERTVELLVKHDTCQLVRQGEGPEGQR